MLSCSRLSFTLQTITDNVMIQTKYSTPKMNLHNDVKCSLINQKCTVVEMDIRFNNHIHEYWSKKL